MLRSVRPLVVAAGVALRCGAAAACAPAKPPPASFELLKVWPVFMAATAAAQDSALAAAAPAAQASATKADLMIFSALATYGVVVVAMGAFSAARTLGTMEEVASAKEAAASAIAAIEAEVSANKEAAASAIAAIEAEVSAYKEAAEMVISAELATLKILKGESPRSS